MEEGSYTLKKRSVLPSSSAPKWASMFMGAGTELHGYTQWGSKTPELASREIGNYGIFPNIWGVFRDANPDAEIGYIHEWDGLKYIADTAAMSFRKEIVGFKEKPEDIVKVSVEYIKRAKPNLLAIIIDNPDAVGHNVGHDSQAYYDTLAVLDNYIGSIAEAVRDAGIFEETIFIITSDHGGIEKNHGKATLEEMETPFIISGKGVKKNYNFTESMMQYDVASTIAYIFGLDQPQVWIGRPMKQVFIDL
jgi:predicted AlkP superfamily pyrophosphatase or phosphodiesterase